MGETQTQTSTGNLNAALTYFLGWVTGLVFLLSEKEDDFIRFHAAQSLIAFGGLTVVFFIPVLGQLLSLVLWPLSLVLWVLLMVKAYQGERFKLPVVGDFAEQLRDSIGK